MTTVRATQPSHTGGAPTARARRPGHLAPPAPLGPAGATEAAARPVAGAGAGVDPVDRLEGIRVRLAALAPLLQDEPARRLAAVLREVEALVDQLGRPSTGEAEAGASRAVRPAQGAGHHGPEVPAPVHPHPAATVPPTRHRPPALPCGPDYPLLPAHRAS
jgi:hypothetical protein